MRRVVYGILGEDETDTDTLHAILRNLARAPDLVARGRGFEGKGNLLKRGAGELKSLRDEGCGRFVVLIDAEGDDPIRVRDGVEGKIVRPAGVTPDCCIVVAVQAIESWILADIDAAMLRWKKHPAWRPAEVKEPELFRNPKAELVRLSRQGKVRPRYDPPIHNPQIAPHLDTNRIAAKCPSFRPLSNFVKPEAP